MPFFPGWLPHTCMAVEEWVCVAVFFCAREWRPGVSPGASPGQRSPVAGPRTCPLAPHVGFACDGRELGLAGWAWLVPRSRLPPPPPPLPGTGSCAPSSRCAPVPYLPASGLACLCPSPAPAQIACFSLFQETTFRSAGVAVHEGQFAGLGPSCVPYIAPHLSAAPTASAGQPPLLPADLYSNRALLGSTTAFTSRPLEEVMQLLAEVMNRLEMSFTLHQDAFKVGWRLSPCCVRRQAGAQRDAPAASVGRWFHHEERTHTTSMSTWCAFALAP
jgi:hypothetical protein